MTTAMNPASLVSRTLATVLERINTGRYSVVLPPQDQIAAELKVSRTVLREAVVILRFCNVLDVRPKIGSRINERSAWKPAALEILEGAANEQQAA